MTKRHRSPCSNIIIFHRTMVTWTIFPRNWKTNIFRLCYDAMTSKIYKIYGYYITIRLVKTTNKTYGLQPMAHCIQSLATKLVLPLLTKEIVLNPVSFTFSSNRNAKKRNHIFFILPLNNNYDNWFGGHVHYNKNAFYVYYIVLYCIQ